MTYDDVILKGREEFLENAWSFTFWGVVGSILPLLSILLSTISSGQFKPYAYYPLLGFPLAGCFTTWVIVKNTFKKKSFNPISYFLTILWGVVSINVIILAFGMPLLFGNVLIPVIFLLLGLAQIGTGVLINVPILLFGGVAIHLLVLIHLVLAAYFQDLFGRIIMPDMILLILISIIGQLMPGIVLKIKEENNK